MIEKVEEYGTVEPLNSSRFGIALRTLLCILMFLELFMASIVNAADLETPTGPVLLEIVGEIKLQNATVEVGGEVRPAAVFDIAMLESLPQETIRTKTEWTSGVTEFTGVRVDVLLNHIGASSQHLFLQALDEYNVEIVDGQFDSFPIIVAYKLNGKYMSVRELGPLWVMYPFDDHPVLNSEQSRAHCVWQLTRITIR